MEINIDNWKEFDLTYIFDEINKGTRLKKEDRRPGDTPLITAGEINNGLACYIDKNNTLFSDKCLTIDMFGNTFYRNYDFYADDNVIILKNDNITEGQLLFIASVISKITSGYNYKDQFRLNNVNKTKVPLPAKYCVEKEEYEPDWDYMEYFIKELKETNDEKLKLIKEIKPVDDEIDISDWHEFEVGELFNAITKTAKVKDFTRENYKDDVYSIPALSSLALNNSHGFYVKKSEHELVDSPSLSVTSNGVNAGTVFVQTEPFAIVQDAYALIIKDHNPSKEVYLFVATTLEKLLIEKYGFNEKAVWSKVKKELLPLPAIYNQEKEEYEPDWEYMKKFITNLQANAIDQIRRLKQKDE